MHIKYEIQNRDLIGLDLIVAGPNFPGPSCPGPNRRNLIVADRHILHITIACNIFERIEYILKKKGTIDKATK